jgi:hypothetical protein
MIHMRLHMDLGVISYSPFLLFKGFVNGGGVHVEVLTRSWEASRIPHNKYCYPIDWLQIAPMACDVHQNAISSIRPVISFIYLTPNVELF